MPFLLHSVPTGIASLSNRSLNPILDQLQKRFPGSARREFWCAGSSTYGTNYAVILGDRSTVLGRRIFKPGSGLSRRLFNFAWRDTGSGVGVREK